MFAIAVAWHLGLRALGLVDARAQLRSVSERLGMLESNKAEMDSALEAASQTVLKLADHEDRLQGLETKASLGAMS